MTAGQPDEARIEAEAIEPSAIEVSKKVRQVLQSTGHVRGGELDKATQELTEITMTMGWSGPLPPPAILRQYDLLKPGCAGEIMGTFTTQVAHRQNQERRQLTLSFFGMICGILSLTLMLALAAFALYLQYPWVSVTIATALTGVAAIFVIRQPTQQSLTPKSIPATSQSRRRKNNQQN